MNIPVTFFLPPLTGKYLPTCWAPLTACLQLTSQDDRSWLTRVYSGASSHTSMRQCHNRFRVLTREPASGCDFWMEPEPRFQKIDRTRPEPKVRFLRFDGTRTRWVSIRPQPGSDGYQISLDPTRKTAGFPLKMPVFCRFSVPVFVLHLDPEPMG